MIRVGSTFSIASILFEITGACFHGIKHLDKLLENGLERDWRQSPLFPGIKLWSNNTDLMP